MNFLELFDNFIFDLDGVIYTENKATKKSPEVLSELRKNSKNVLFITNNPSRSPYEYKNKLKSLDIYSKPDEFITSPMAIKYYLETKYKKLSKKRAYVIGSNYLKKEVGRTGINSLKEESSYKADLVIMGGHNKFNFNEIKTATLIIRNGADFIATNRDYYYPTQQGLAPATGALLSSIEIASQKKAVIVGKPERYIFELIDRYLMVNKERTLFIGDNLKTDVLGGTNAGFKTALTLTGYNKKHHLKKSKIKPDFIIKDLTELV